MSKTKPVIALSGGGSGGHITPLLSLAHELKLQSPQCRLVYIGHKGDNFDSLRLRTDDLDFLVFLNAGKFRRYHGESLVSHLLDVKTIALNVRDVFRVVKSVYLAWKALGRFNVDVVFAKGGFVSVPVGLAARLRRIPIVTHDSDAIGGLANRIVGRWAKVRATGMPVVLYPKTKARLVYVGIPLSPNIKPVSAAEQVDYRRQLGLDDKAQVLLVGGASLGSQRLNELTLAAADTLLRVNPRLHIFHLSGAVHAESVKQEYSAILSSEQLQRVTCMGFTPDFYKYSAAADVIVSRAGATALAEFALQGKACIIIPSPFLAGGHQLKNAQELVRHDAAVVLQESCTVDEFEATLNLLFSDNKRRHQLAANIHKSAKADAAEHLARIVLEQVNG